ncbi:hypothetical protein GCM10010472_19250 [Pseudonocardia halophobica]|uniref:AMP-binding enzyme n=1 Tax=Pseudonocardia halophobica TaxID=29401 RepID=A0A9W6L0D2_9PSEU|nr:hypothetical protein [Pseudonocardia halophobica]GLL09861.1 hypothetical protein GCM10017577_10010 [Pseudonocardia halophobica]
MDQLAPPPVAAIDRDSVPETSRALTLDALLTRAARKAPDNLAIRHREEHVGYAELDERVDRLAGVLARGAWSRASAS